MAHIGPEKIHLARRENGSLERSRHVHFLTHSLHYGLAAFEGIRAYVQHSNPAKGARSSG